MNGYSSLTIERMPQGGFVVSEGRGMDPSRFYGPLFACTDVGEALNFVRGKLAQVCPEGDLRPEHQAAIEKAAHSVRAAKACSPVY